MIWSGFTQLDVAAVLVWGAVATAAMTTFTEGAQLFGQSRMSLPFLFGSFVSGRRDRATVWGFVLYSLGALLFAFFYSLAFEAIGRATWWIGAGLGLLHGLFLITVFLPLLPHLHPRMASEYDGPDAERRLEPPGRFGLNYGSRTPLITVAGQMLFGLVLGAAYAVG